MGSELDLKEDGQALSILLVMEDAHKIGYEKPSNICLDRPFGVPNSTGLIVKTGTGSPRFHAFRLVTPAEL